MKCNVSFYTTQRTAISPAMFNIKPIPVQRTTAFSSHSQQIHRDRTVLSRLVLYRTVKTSCNRGIITSWYALHGRDETRRPLADGRTDFRREGVAAAGGQRGHGGNGEPRRSVALLEVDDVLGASGIDQVHQRQLRCHSAVTDDLLPVALTA